MDVGVRSQSGDLLLLRYILAFHTNYVQIVSLFIYMGLNIPNGGGSRNLLQLLSHMLHVYSDERLTKMYDVFKTPL